MVKKYHDWRGVVFMIGEVDPSVTPTPPPLTPNPRNRPPLALTPRAGGLKNIMIGEADPYPFSLAPNPPKPPPAPAHPNPEFKVGGHRMLIELDLLE